LICLRDDIAKMQDKNIPIFIPNDGHLSKEMHHLVAQKIAARINTEEILGLTV